MWTTGGGDSLQGLNDGWKLNNNKAAMTLFSTNGRGTGPVGKYLHTVHVQCTCRQWRTLRWRVALGFWRKSRYGRRYVLKSFKYGAIALPSVYLIPIQYTFQPEIPL